jgi:hypothetical protein
MVGVMLIPYFLNVEIAFVMSTIGDISLVIFRLKVYLICEMSRCQHEAVFNLHSLQKSARENTKLLCQALNL